MSEQPLGPAILSLLVAADQRCAAIIGAAHLLYYSRLGTTQANAEMTFDQLKGDVAELNKAVAAVEAAMQSKEAA